MAVRSRSMVPSTASIVLVQPEKDAEERLCGLLYNPYLDESRRFRDIMDFTGQLDAMFDAISFPQAAMAYRSFEDGPKPKDEKAGPQPMPAEEAVRLEEGGKGVFRVHVKFRQNATWQGTVRWPGQPGEVRFRSTLELIKLMDDALEPKENP